MMPNHSSSTFPWTKWFGNWWPKGGKTWNAMPKACPQVGYPAATRQQRRRAILTSHVPVLTSPDGSAVSPQTVKNLSTYAIGRISERKLPTTFITTTGCDDAPDCRPRHRQQLAQKTTSPALTRPLSSKKKPGLLIIVSRISSDHSNGGGLCVPA